MIFVGIVMLSNQSGFTLLELLAAVSIIALLGAIAVPEYKDYHRRLRCLELARGYDLNQDTIVDVDDFSVYASYFGDFNPFTTAGSAYLTTRCGDDLSCIQNYQEAVDQDMIDKIDWSGDGEINISDFSYYSQAISSWYSDSCSYFYSN